jgi:hypothetical protein
MDLVEDFLLLIALGVLFHLDAGEPIPTRSSHFANGELFTT